MLDVYKKTAIVTQSDEHILLNAFGGRWSSRDLIDKTTNDGFGHGIDAGLADAFLSIRVLLDAKSGEGLSPPPLKGASSEDGEIYNLNPGGLPEMAKPQVCVSKDPDGSTSIDYTVRSMQELHRLTSRVAVKAGLSKEEIEARATIGEFMPPRLHTRTKLGPAAWRAMAKMVCNLLAESDRDVFLGEEFDDVRGFVLKGGNPWDFVAINTNPVEVTSGPGALGPLDHLLLVRSDADSGLVSGLVAIYGHFQVCIRLGVLQCPKPIATSYRVDQLGRIDRVNAPADLKIHVPLFVPLSATNRNVWFQAASAAMNKTMPFVMEQADRAAISQMVSKSMEDAFGPPGHQQDTQERRLEFVRALSARVRSYVEHRGQVVDADELVRCIVENAFGDPA